MEVNGDGIEGRMEKRRDGLAANCILARISRAAYFMLKLRIGASAECKPECGRRGTPTVPAIAIPHLTESCSTHGWLHGKRSGWRLSQSAFLIWTEAFIIADMFRSCKPMDCAANVLLLFMHDGWLSNCGENTWRAPESITEKVFATHSCHGSADGMA